MRLKPSEVRIVNAIRGLKQGRVQIFKAADGQVEVVTKQRLEPESRPSESTGGGAARVVHKLRD